MTRSSRYGLVCVFFATVLWSTIEVVARTLVGKVTPLQIAGARFCLAACLLGPVLPFVLRRRGLRFTRGFVLHAAWLSLLGAFIPSIALQYSLERVGASVVATVWGTMPSIVMVLSFFVLGERLTRRKILGVVLGFFGIVVLSMSRTSHTFSLAGLGFAVLSNVCFSSFTVFVKRYAGAYAGLPITALCALMASMLFVPTILVEGEMATLSVLEEVWVPLVYLGICATGLSYLLYFTGLERVEATQAASVVFLKPLLATFLATLWLHEPLTWNALLALLFVLGGLYFVVVTSPRPRAPVRARTFGGE